MMKPLQGRRILVTRPAAQAVALAGMIEAQGGEPVCFPLLEISPADDLAPLQKAVDQLDDYAFAVFVSANAVKSGLSRILSQREWPAGVRVAAVGQGTAKQLSASGITEVIVPSGRSGSEALLALPEFRADGIAGKNVLILRGNGGREFLADTLSERGATVTCVSCYRRSAPARGMRLVSLLRNNRLDALTISSNEGLRNLWVLLDTEGRERVRTLPVFVPHQRIAETAVHLGLQRVVLSEQDDTGITESLCNFNWLHHE